MASTDDDLYPFLALAPGDHWVVLAKALLDMIGPKRSELRFGLNWSPFLERYVVGYIDGSITGSQVCLVPLFSCRGTPGLYLMFDDIEPAKYIPGIATRFGQRLWFEELCTDWPEDAHDLMRPFDEPRLDLVDGDIVKLNG